jgi:hypothetical protein
MVVQRINFRDDAVKFRDTLQEYCRFLNEKMGGNYLEFRDLSRNWDKQDYSSRIVVNTHDRAIRKAFIKACCRENMHYKSGIFCYSICFEWTYPDFIPLYTPNEMETLMINIFEKEYISVILKTRDDVINSYLSRPGLEQFMEENAHIVAELKDMPASNIEEGVRLNEEIEKFRKLKYDWVGV